jgi:hypothetical protein
MRNFLDKSVEKIKTHILRSHSFSEDHAGYERMWKNVGHPARPHTNTEYGAANMPVACRVTKYEYTHTHTHTHTHTIYNM